MAKLCFGNRPIVFNEPGAHGFLKLTCVIINVASQEQLIMPMGVNGKNYNNENKGNLNINLISYLQHRADRDVSDITSSRPLLDLVYPIQHDKILYCCRLYLICYTNYQKSIQKTYTPANIYYKQSILSFTSQSVIHSELQRD